MLFLSVKLRLFAYSWQIYAKRTAKVLLLCLIDKKQLVLVGSFHYNIQKKAWNPTVVVPRSEAFALPDIQEQQREAHAEYKLYSRAIF